MSIGAPRQGPALLVCVHGRGDPPPALLAQLVGPGGLALDGLIATLTILDHSLRGGDIQTRPSGPQGTGQFFINNYKGTHPAGKTSTWTGQGFTLLRTIPWRGPCVHVCPRLSRPGLRRLILAAPAAWGLSAHNTRCRFHGIKPPSLSWQIGSMLGSFSHPNNSPARGIKARRDTPCRFAPTNIHDPFSEKAAGNS